MRQNEPHPTLTCLPFSLFLFSDSLARCFHSPRCCLLSDSFLTFLIIHWFALVLSPASFGIVIFRCRVPFSGVRLSILSLYFKIWNILTKAEPVYPKQSTTFLYRSKVITKIIKKELNQFVQKTALHY